MVASDKQSPTTRDPILSISMETWVYQAARKIGRTGGGSGSPQINIQILGQTSHLQGGTWEAVVWSEPLPSASSSATLDGFRLDRHVGTGFVTRYNACPLSTLRFLSKEGNPGR